MMTRMSSAVGPEALSRRERISSGLSSMLRDGGKMGNAASTRREKLLGVSPPAASSPLDSSPSSDFCELKEEDIWGVDDSYSNPSEDQYQHHHNHLQQQVVPESDQSRLLKSGKQWIEQPSPLGLSSINRPTSNAASKDASVIAATGAVRKSTTTTASRMIPQVSISSFDSNRHQSAPMNIPDWSKILRVDKRGDKENGVGFGLDDDDDEELKDASHQKLPPHLLVAREYAKSHTAFSVYEGAGRTLKGMDLSRVRNAVWKQTGFIGG